MGARLSRGMITSATAFALSMIVGSSAFATLLPPGGLVALSPTPSPAGAVPLTGPLVDPFISVDATSFSGTLTSQVFTNDAGNPFGLNSLTFTFILHNNGPDPLEQLSTVDWSGYLTDVSFSTSAPVGPVPFAATRSVNGPGRIIGFQFDVLGPSSLPPGATSTMMVVHTNATQFMPVVNSVINGSVAVADSYGPVPIPEPAALGVVALGGLLAVRRRTRD